MIEIIYNGDEPIIINNIEFRKNKFLKIEEEKLTELRKNSFFSIREKKFFKILNEDNKQKNKQENKDNNINNLQNLAYNDLRKKAKELNIEVKKNIKKEEIIKILKNANIK